jgi:hypothetical protein
VLIGTEYWSGLLDWTKNTVLAHGCISKEDLDLFVITDDSDVAVKMITAHYKKLLEEKEHKIKRRRQRREEQL